MTGLLGASCVPVASQPFHATTVTVTVFRVVVWGTLVLVAVVFLVLVYGVFRAGGVGLIDDIDQ